MKKAFSILLISILIFCTFGYELLFSILLNQYKENAAKLISSDKVIKNEVVIVINSKNKNLIHRRNNHEVEYGGILYDIRKENRKGDDLILYAVMDVNEQNLVNNFRKENSNDNKTGENSKAQINGKDLYRIYLISMTLQTFSKNLIAKINIPSVTEYNQPDKQLNTHPPQSL